MTQKRDISKLSKSMTNMKSEKIDYDILEWDLLPVYNEHGVPVMAVYQCPYCRQVSNKQYEVCPNPFCKKVVGED